MTYLTEPGYTHGTPEKTGILLVNLGTPDAPTAKAVRPYLKQFLGDRRVVEIPRAIWWLILNGIILNVRPKKSAEKYASVWLAEGSPLRVYTEKQAIMLQGYLGERTRAPFAVEFAMTYGNPSIPDAMRRLKAQNCQRILVVPLFPQYAASSTAPVFDQVFGELQKMRNIPAIRTLKHFHDDAGYIKSLAANINEYWTKHGRPEKLVMSFHGVPQYTLDKGDPYHCECHKSGRLLAEALGLTREQYVVSFQSRFGRAEWIKPYTTATLLELGRQKTRRVDIVCPGFVGDCLETLEEIAMEGREDFQHAGGGEYHYIPCLNDRDDWMRALTDLVMDNLQGWLNLPDAADREKGRLLALAMGAK
ncbi:MAG TPA: ferrochelatase [Gallionella sp.]|nr:MAG: ferrochelatase [Gallionellales bacterium GWA2_54_124]OGT20489.1 MAG: ferrochelatase [Gallionellales bacterium RIFOXYD12_FULL_53_10]OGT42587.1 MAG: ferrochelatase [Gallionellales bacterium RIFOXYD2_FULL_52_7]HCI51951.1 ferrochelatase [Gallionella sp.]